MKQENENSGPDIYGLIGYPLGHSFSARYFRRKFDAEGINAVYRNFEIPDISMVRDVIADNENLRGFNVTIPYKQQIIPYLDSVDRRATEIGAVNVVSVSRKDGKVRLNGHNSDVIGFIDTLRPLLRREHNAALVLGTGGASKAVVYGLHELGIKTQYVSRHKREDTIAYEEIDERMMESHKLIVNCTPLGMYPNVDRCPDIPYQLLTPLHLLYDLVYNPALTLFLSKGRDAGATVKNGMDMLIRQAEVSWDFWNE